MILTSKPELPPHLKDIDFKPWHFYKMEKAGKVTIDVNADFITEVMRQKKIKHHPEFEIHSYGDDGMIAIARIDVWTEGNNKETTSGFASMTKMPHQDGQTHFAQMCITRALKVAVMRHLGISDNDIKILIEHYGYTPKGSKSYQVSTDGEEPLEKTLEEPEELNLEL
jgi:hypothetical protein